MTCIFHKKLTGPFWAVIICVLIGTLVAASCTRRGGRFEPTPQDNSAIPADNLVVPIAKPIAPAKAPASQHPNVNIYIENSGSMNGFINNASGFQDAIQKMMVLLKYYYGSECIKLNYINTAIHPQQVPANVSVEDFAVKMLTPAKFKGTGNVHSTDLNDIVGMILKGVNEDSISILISDCIYSIVGDGTTSTLLTGCKNKTMGAFLEKTKEYPDLATTIVRLTSHFDGYYWDYKHPSGKASQSLSCDRPYYMCIIGTESNIDLFNDHIEVEEMRGYENKYVLSCSDFSDCKYSVLTRSHCKAMFRVNGTPPYKTLEHARSHGGQFQFAIAVDLSNIPMSSSEKLDLNNYSVIQGAYQVVDVCEVAPVTMHPTDRNIVQSLNLTHEIVVSTNQYPTDLIVGVKRDIPQWVKMSSSTDDTSINESDEETTKTFGLEYFVTGISDAYREASPNKDFSTELNVRIKHSR